VHREVIVAIVCCAAAGVAHATPGDDLDKARSEFLSGNFADAIPRLNYLLYPTPRLAEPDDLVEAHVLFGACAFQTGDNVTARQEFEAALTMNPDYAIDTNRFSAGAVHFFDETKHALEERMKRDAAERALAEEKDRLRRYRESLVVYEVRPYYVNFIPFGAGQFQNGQHNKGLWFATTEATTGALSAGIWVYLVASYGFDGRVPPQDANFARTLQQIEIGAGGLCLGLMAWGIVDSLVHYHPRAQVEADDSLLPPDLRKKPPPPPRSSFYVTPAVVPGGAGVVFTWER
jgi:tetratricopeptide (TPR) repeat protein